MEECKSTFTLLAQQTIHKCLPTKMFLENRGLVMNSRCSRGTGFGDVPFLRGCGDWTTADELYRTETESFGHFIWRTA